MNYYFINTDSDARKDVRTCDLWFEYSMAFSGGDLEKYGLPLQRLKPFDICLMYHNRVGIVGVGRVLENWDNKPHTNKLVYLAQPFNEYRISIDWYIDLRNDHEIDPQSEFGYIPRGLLKPISKNKQKVEKLLKDLEALSYYRSPDELYLPSYLQEGRVRNVPVDIHERNPVARKKCIEHYGAICNVCGFKFSDNYGSIGDGLIHVHHVIPIGMSKVIHQVDPVKDLRPVCANCHTVIHRQAPPFTIQEVKIFIEDKRNIAKKK
jgi:predicted HNH restriction endonuclease